jgi:sugar O-acyltransferase (sialic acid O-acetyltransferase NeuD family)
MTPLVIAGAGGFGRELAAYARDAGFDVAGFLDDDESVKASLSGPDRDAGLRGPIRSYAPQPGETVAIGIGHVATRLRVAEALLERGAQLTNVVHPTAWVAPSASLGEGVALAPFVCVGPDVRVGDLTMLNMYASLGHDTVVGRCCVLAPYSFAAGYSTLEDEAFLASHAVVTPGKRIGARARISAGAVVFHDIPPGWLAAGSPARARPVPERFASVDQAPLGPAAT